MLSIQTKYVMILITFHFILNLNNSRRKKTDTRTKERYIVNVEICISGCVCTGETRTPRCQLLLLQYTQLALLLPIIVTIILLCRFLINWICKVAVEWKWLVWRYIDSYFSPFLTLHSRFTPNRHWPNAHTYPYSWLVCHFLLFQFDFEFKTATHFLVI